MTRAFVNVAAYKQSLLELTGLMGTDCPWDYQRDYAPLENDPVLRALCAGIRWAAPDIQKFRELFGSVLRENGLRQCRMFGVILLGPTFDTLRVFPNIQLDYTALDAAVADDTDVAGALRHMTPFTYAREGLADFLRIYSAEKAYPRKAKGWETLRRSLQRLKKSEVMTTVRALSRYTSLGTHCGDQDLLCIAAEMDNLRRPLELCFADTPEDFLAMYDSGPKTCMVQGGAAASAGWRWMLEKGVHPTSFFAYHPYVRGAYVVRDGAIHARTMVYQQADGRWQYGRVYPNDAAGIQLTRLLGENGFTPLPVLYNRKAPSGVPLGDYERQCEFNIPGVRYDKTGDYCCPTPYFDNMCNSLHVKFDKDTAEFNVRLWSHSAKGNVSRERLSGMVSQADLDVFNCHNCSGIIEKGGGCGYQGDARIRFCGPRCVVAAGFCMALRGDASSVVLREVEALRDACVPSRWYVNEVAARSHGCRPVTTTFRQEPEESEDNLTRGQHAVHINGQEFFIPATHSGGSLFNRLADAYGVSERGFHSLHKPFQRCHLTGKVTVKKQRVVQYDPTAPVAVFTKEFVLPQRKAIEFELSGGVAVMAEAPNPRGFMVRVQEAA